MDSESSGIIDNGLASRVCPYGIGWGEILHNACANRSLYAMDAKLFDGSERVKRFPGAHYADERGNKTNLGCGAR